MPKIALLFSVLLIVVGLVGYLGSEPKAVLTSASGTGAVGSAGASNTAASTQGKRSATALIPAFAGILLGICGLIGLNENLRKHAMHGAAMVALLGTLAGVGRGGMKLAQLIGGDASVNQRSLVFVFLMALLCGIFVVLCVQSFRNARKIRDERLANETGETEAS